MKSMKKTAFSILFTLFLAVPGFTQHLTDARTRWADSFVEWILYSTPDTAQNEEPQPEETGKLALRWPNSHDFSEWDIEQDDLRGTIKQKWKNDPNRWELRADGEAITIKTRWDGDFTEWKITDDTRTLHLKTRFNSPDEWLTTSSEFGRFYMYSLFRGDPRDWAIEDDLSPEISRAMRLAMVFVVLFQSSPKE